MCLKKTLPQQHTTAIIAAKNAKRVVKVVTFARKQISFDYSIFS